MASTTTKPSSSSPPPNPVEDVVTFAVRPGMILELIVPERVPLIATEPAPARTRMRLQTRPQASQPAIATARRHCTWAWG